MAISFVAAGASNSNTGGASTNFTIDFPAGIQADDIIIGIWVTGNTPATDWTASGFSSLFNTTLVTGSGHSARVRGYWKRVTGSEGASITVTTGASSALGQVMQMFAYRGCHTTTNPASMGTFSSATDDTTFSATSTSTALSTGDWAVGLWGSGETCGAWTSDDMTISSGAVGTYNIRAAEANGGASNNQRSMHVADKDVTTGATATITWSGTLGTASTDTGGFVRLVAAAAGGGSTNAPAENAAGTGAANNATAALTVNAGNAASTGAANNATVTTETGGVDAGGVNLVLVPPGLNQFQNLQPRPWMGSDSEIRDRYVTPQESAATVTAYDATVTVGGSPGQGSGTGAANNATTSLTVNAENAAATGAAHDATVTTTTSGSTDGFYLFQIAPGLNQFQNLQPRPWMGSDAEIQQRIVTPQESAATGGVPGPYGSGPYGGGDFGAGSFPRIGANAGSGTGTGSANNATVSTSGSANAQVASATGVANDATVAIGGGAGQGAGTGSSGNGTGALGPNAGNASGTGVAHNGTVALGVNAENATGTGAANNATVTTGGGGGSGIQLVHENVGDIAATTSTTQSITTVAAGNFVVAFVSRSGGTGTGSLSGVTDSAGQTWTLATRGGQSGANHTRIECWYKENSAAITSVTFNSTASQYYAYTVLEFSGIVTSGALDVASPNYSGAASALTQTTPTIVTTNANDLIIAAIHYPQATSTDNDGTFTRLSNFDATTSGSGRASYKVVGSTGNYSDNWTLGTSQAAGLVTVAFKGTAAPVNASAGTAFANAAAGNADKSLSANAGPSLEGGYGSGNYGAGEYVGGPKAIGTAHDARVDIVNFDPVIHFRAPGLSPFSRAASWAGTEDPSTTPVVQAPAENASATGTANTATSALGVNADGATGTGVAYNGMEDFVCQDFTTVVSSVRYSAVVTVVKYSANDADNCGR